MRKCHNREERQIVCAVCGREFSTYYLHKKTCGKECSEVYREIGKRKGQAERNARYFVNNKEKCNQQCREYRSRNLEKTKERLKKYREENREAVNKSTRQWYKKNPLKKIIVNMRHSTKRHEAGIMPPEIFLNARLKMFGGCAYCGKRSKLVVEHVIPLSKGGTNKLNNLLGACKSCNSSKSNRDWKEWFNGQLFYNPNQERIIESAIRRLEFN